MVASSDARCGRHQLRFGADDASGGLLRKRLDLNSVGLAMYVVLGSG